MKFEIEQEVFLSAVSRVAGALDSKHMIAALQGVHLALDESGLKVRATDLKVDITTQIDAEGMAVLDPGETVVAGKFLLDLLKRLPEGRLTCELKETTFHLRSGSGRYKLATYDPAQFPQEADFGEPMFALPQPLLRELIRRTAHVPDKDDTARPYLQGVCMVFKGPHLTLTATDGLRIARSKTQVENPHGKELVVILPAVNLKDLAQALSSREGDVTVHVTDSVNLAAFKLGATQVVIRLLDGDFPDVDRLVPTTYSSVARFDTDLLLGALERAGLSTPSVKLEFLHDKCVLTAEAQTVKVYEEVAGTLTGEPVSMGFNPTLLIEGLKTLGVDEAVVEMNSSNAPIRLLSESMFDGRQVEQMYVALPLLLPA